MNCTEFISLIETFAPLGAAASWDNSGIQIAGARDDIKKICLALDPTPATVSAALELKADFLLCHHPLLFAPRFLNTRDQYFHVVRKLIHADCWLYSAHTSLDVNPRATMSWLAKALNLKGCEFLEPVQDAPADSPAQAPDSGSFQAPPGYGYGLAGTLPAPLPINDFLSCLETALLPESARQDWRICGQTPKTVQKIAYCPGSGASLAGNALSLQADLYITGDIKYHAALEAPLCMIDVGHFCLEERMMHELAYTLSRLRPDLEIKFLAADNPFRQVAI